MKLNDLYKRFFELDQKIEDQYGEITEQDLAEEAEIDESLEWHIDNQALKFHEAKAEAEKCKELAKRYKNRQDMFERSMDWRKRVVFELLRLKGGKHKSAVATVYTSKAQATMKVLDEAKIPETYKSQITVIDTASLKKDLIAGAELDCAEIIPGIEFVVIR